MDFVKLSEQRFTAKKFDANKKIPRDDVEKLKKILQLSPSSVNSQPWVFLWGSNDNSKKRVRLRSLTSTGTALTLALISS